MPALEAPSFVSENHTGSCNPNRPIWGMCPPQSTIVCSTPPSRATQKGLFELMPVRTISCAFSSPTVCCFFQKASDDCCVSRRSIPVRNLRRLLRIVVLKDAIVEGYYLKDTAF